MRWQKYTYLPLEHNCSLCGLQRPVLKAGVPPRPRHSHYYFLSSEENVIDEETNSRRKGDRPSFLKQLIKYEIGFLSPCIVGILNLCLELRVCHLFHEMLVFSREALHDK